MNRRAIHVERGKRLEYLTIAYNSLEGIAAVVTLAWCFAEGCL